MADKKIWDFWANHYQNLWVQKLSLEPTRIEIINQLKNQIIDKEKTYNILDIGCGTGQLLRDLQTHFKEYSFSIIGIDYSEQMIKQAKKNQKKYELQRFKNKLNINKIKKEKINIHNKGINEQTKKDVSRVSDLLGIKISDTYKNEYNESLNIDKERNTKYIKMDANDIHNIQDRFDVIICTHSLPYYEDQREVISKMLKLLKTDGLLYLALASENSFYDSLVMKFVKLTVGKASYPSVRRMKYMTADRADMIITKKIPVKFFIPSLYMFVLKKKQL